jgi:hypothetical protein
LALIPAMVFVALFMMLFPDLSRKQRSVLEYLASLLIENALTPNATEPLRV